MTAAFRLQQPAHQYRLTLADPPRPPQSLTERYRPRSLDAVVGQEPVVWRIRAFLQAPYSTAFLFEGPTGVGKTTVAMAVAAELGACEFGGLEIIKSGMQDADAVERVLDGLRFTPMLGSGWKVIIVDEADYMSPKAAQLWLSALEDLPSRSVVIFTTNDSGRFKDRFLDRCERLRFEADAASHVEDAQMLIDRVWAAEVGDSNPPDASRMEPVIVDQHGHLSYRRVIRALEPRIVAARSRQAPPAPVITIAAGKPRRASRADSFADAADWHAYADRYRAGMSLRAISRELGLDLYVVERNLERVGVVWPKRGPRRLNR
jgi:replication-associated recombination protein RarA